MVETIKINVGGTIFETTKATLMRKIANNRQHLLEEIFTSGRYYPASTCSDRSFLKPDDMVYIDRDPVYFRYILNYLRDFPTFRSQDYPIFSYLLKFRMGDELNQFLKLEFKYYKIYDNSLPEYPQ